MNYVKYMILVLLTIMNNIPFAICEPISNPINDKEVHIQNMKDELFMMKYGYWIKTKDKLDEIYRECELKKFKQLQRGHPSQFKYESKSNYPEIILQKIDEPPKFENADINLSYNSLTINDNLDGNIIIYTHTKYLIDYNPSFKHNSGPISNDNIQLKYNLIDKQLEIKIKSLESMIYLFENLI